jgi:hypothetical protein
VPKACAWVSRGGGGSGKRVHVGGGDGECNDEAVRVKTEAGQTRGEGGAKHAHMCGGEPGLSC